MWHSSLVDVTAFTLCFPCRTQRFLAINKLGSPCFPGITPLLITSFMTCTPTRAILPAVRECIHALKHTVKRRYPSLSTSERRLLVAHSLRYHNIHGLDPLSVHRRHHIAHGAEPGASPPTGQS
jgi:hypothetical protein